MNITIHLTIRIFLIVTLFNILHIVCAYLFLFVDGDLVDDFFSDYIEKKKNRTALGIIYEL